MTERKLAPWQVHWVDFTPQLGREQSGLRPAVVISSSLSCRIPNGLVYVAPCTARLRGLDIHPVVDLDRPSAVLCDQIKAIDYARITRPHPSKLTTEEIENIKRVLRRLFDFT